MGQRTPVEAKQSMPAPPELIAACKKLFMEKDMAGRWKRAEAELDYDALSHEVIGHFLAPPAEGRKPLETIITCFIEDYPLIRQLSWDLVCQRKLDEYLNKIAFRKFDSLPHFLTTSDIVQESMTKIFNKLDTFHYMSRFRTWCTTILIRTGLELIRKENRREAVEGISMDDPIGFGDNERGRHETIPIDLPDPEAEYMGKELLRLIDRSLEKSKNKERDRYILLQRMEGVLGKTIAHELSISLRTVNMFMDRFKSAGKK